MATSFLPLRPCVRNLRGCWGRGSGGRKAVCRCPLCICRSIATLHGAGSVSPRLALGESCGSKEAGRWGSPMKEKRSQSCRERREVFHIVNKRESDHETGGSSLYWTSSNCSVKRLIPGLLKALPLSQATGIPCSWVWAEWGERCSVWLYPIWLQKHRPSKVPWARYRETLGKLLCWGTGQGWVALDDRSHILQLKATKEEEEPT